MSLTRKQLAEEARKQAVLDTMRREKRLLNESNKTHQCNMDSLTGYHMD